MTSDSLLAHLAWRFPGTNEDVATEALSYILCKQEGARTALADLLRSGGADPEPMDSFDTQRVFEGPRPDLVASSKEREVLLIESKFWASLTSHQPNGYLQLMMDDLPDARNLLFIAPEVRQDELWKELPKQASEKFQVTDERATDGVRSVAVSSDGHRLMLTSWHTLLKRLEHSSPDEDCDLRQLRGLCTPSSDDAPFSSVDASPDTGVLSEVAHYKSFLKDVVDRARSLGIITTKGLRYGGGIGVFGRFFRFVNTADEELATAWVGFSLARPRDFFLWLIDNETGVKAEPGRTKEVYPQISEELDKDGHISIPISATAGYAYVRQQVLGKLKEIRDRIAVSG